MTEEERLELTSAVEDEFTEPLERLEDALEDVDDEIRDAGRGNDRIRIDVESSGIGSAVTELEALDEALEGIDDKVDNLDLDVGETDVGGRGGADIPDPDGGGRTAMTSGGRDLPDPDRFLPPGVSIPGFDKPNAASPQEQRDLMSFLGFEDGLDTLEDLDATDRLLRTDDDVTVTVEERRELFGEDEQSIDDAMGMPNLFGGRNKPTIRENLSQLSENITEMRFTMGTFHNILAASLPILGVFVGAIPAAIVGLGALAGAALAAAGALAAIGGLGAMGMMLAETGQLDTQVLAERLNSILDSFVTAFAPLAESFAPLVSTAMSDIETMMGPLATASEELLAFRGAFQGMSSYITSTAPSLVRDTLAFADAAMPLLAGIASYLGGTSPLAYFGTQLAKALPALQMMGWALTQILPAVVSLSQGFLIMAAGLSGFVGIISWFLNLSPMLTTALGLIAGLFLTLISVTTLYTIVTGELIWSSLTLAGTLLGQAAAGLKAHAINLWGSAVAAWGLWGATVALVSAVTLGIGAVAIFSSQFANLGGNIKGARKELQKFANTGTALDAAPSLGGATPTGRSSNVYQDNSTTVINAGNRDDAARQQYSSQHEQKQHRDSIFGSG